MERLNLQQKLAQHYKETGQTEWADRQESAILVREHGRRNQYGVPMMDKTIYNASDYDFDRPDLVRLERNQLYAYAHSSNNVWQWSFFGTSTDASANVIYPMKRLTHRTGDVETFEPIQPSEGEKGYACRWAIRNNKLYVGDTKVRRLFKYDPKCLYIVQ